MGKIQESGEALISSSACLIPAYEAAAGADADAGMLACTSRPVLMQLQNVSIGRMTPGSLESVLPTHLLFCAESSEQPLLITMIEVHTDYLHCQFMSSCLLALHPR